MMNNNFNNGATNNNSSNGGFIMVHGTITTMKIFAETVKTAMEAHYGADYRVVVQDVNKNNGVVLTGISISKKNCNIAPTIYVNKFFEQYTAGRTLESICREVIHIYEEHKVQTDFDVNCVTDFSKVQNRICYKLINAGKNKELLANMPHVLLEDLAVIFYILVSNDVEGIGTITIKNDMQELWGINTNVLYELALVNTQRLFKGIVKPVVDVLRDALSDYMDEDSFDVTDDEDDVLPMYICTNSAKINGAGAILYTGLLQKFADKFDSDVYILPSSINETLLIPANANMDVEFLIDMVRTVNKTEVSAEEFLSDNVYYYNRLTDRVELA